jgi:hypothetical protein
VPFYEIEIRERGGRVTRASHMVIGDPNAEEWPHVGDRFEYEGCCGSWTSKLRTHRSTGD